MMGRLGIRMNTAHVEHGLCRYGVQGAILTGDMNIVAGGSRNGVDSTNR